MQCLGVVVIVLFSAVTGLALVFALEKTIGLRVAPQIEQDGLDMWYWNEWRKSRKMRVSPKATSTYGLDSRASVSPRPPRTYDGPSGVETASPMKSGA